MVLGKNVSTGKPTEVPVSADGLTVPVSGTLTAVIDESTLATAAKQDTGNTSLGSLDTKATAGNASAASLDGKVGTAAAAGDADANPTVGGIRAFLEVFNGTNWQRVRNGITAVSATLTGMINTLPWAQYNTSPTTRTAAQGGPLEADATGNLRVTEQFLPASSVTSITTATTTLVKSGAGRLGRLIICTPAASATIAVHDAITAVNQVMPTITLPASLVSDGAIPIELQFAFNTGLTIVTTGTTSLAVVWD